MRLILGPPTELGDERTSKYSSEWAAFARERIGVKESGL